MLYATSRLQKMAGLFDDSLANAEAALSREPSLPCIVNHIESLKNAIVSRWHFSMLNDRGAILLRHHHRRFFRLIFPVRNTAYQRALHAAISSWVCDGVTPSVLDIGTGAALLSLCAWKAGGNPIYACEGWFKITNSHTHVYARAHQPSTNMVNMMLFHVVKHHI